VFAEWLLLAPATGLAYDLDKWITGLKVTPFVSQRIEYETNVFQTPEDEQDDLIFRTLPGIAVEWKRGQDAISAAYNAEILKFLNLSGQDNTHHFFGGQVKLELGRFTVSVREDFANTSDPSGSELTGRIESTTNVLSSEVLYKVTDRLSLGGNGAWNYVKYPEFPQLDRNEYLIGPVATWKVVPKVDLLLSYVHGEKFFEGEFAFRDVTRDLVLAGVRGDITPSLWANFRIGYEYRRPETSGLHDYRGLVFGGDWVYKPTERLTLSVWMERSVQESSFVFQPYYVATFGGASAAYRFTPALTATVRLSGGLDSYPIKDVFEPGKFRKDTFFGAGGGIGYDVQKWLRVGAEYSHLRRSSNFDFFDFTDDKVSLFATVKF
jgi:hypothetical protein